MGHIGSHFSYRGTRLVVQVIEDQEGRFHRVGIHPDNEPEVQDSADMQGPLVSDTEERESARLWLPRLAHPQEKKSRPAAGLHRPNR
jgi:hypothetical protein